MRELEAGPGPVHGLCDESRTNGIPEYIAEDGEEMAVSLNGKTLEAALPDMAMAAVMGVVAADMTGHPLLHEGAECVEGRRGHHEVKMIGHQAEAEDLERMPGFGRAEQLQEGGIVGVLVKDGCPTIATVEHMVGMAGGLSTRNARHRA